jgi:hypothetical protein
LRRIVAIDETWIRDFDPELKSQSAQWKHTSSPRPSKCRRQQSKVKQMVIMAFDHEGVIATDHVPVGVSVTGSYYATFLRKKLRQEIRQNRPQLLESGVLILHDNARLHIAQSVKDVMADYKWEVLTHPDASERLTPEEN